jgi:tRNA(Ile)-lysidine synthase
MSFIECLAKSWPPQDWQDVTVVAAVSGGSDSVSLLCGLHELREKQAAGKLIAAHFNHRLRPAADNDARFVERLAKQLDVPCEVGIAAEPVQSSGDGVEAEARSARYDFLLQTAQKCGARFVATAHTADDQAETILHRVLRGTGIAGLAGIPRVRPLSEAVTLIRPLLEFCRADVVEYLSARHQSFCLDESNEDPSFTRNRIRHALLPQLAAQYNPNVREALVRLGQIAAGAQQVIEEAARRLSESCVQIQSPERVEIDCPGLANKSAHLVRELLVLLWKDQKWPQQQMGLQEWNSLAGMIVQSSAEKQFRNLSGNIRAERRDNKLILSRASGE